MLNQTIIEGNLTKDPEIRYTNGSEPKAVAHYRIAVSRDYKGQNGNPITDFFNVQAWGSLAEFAKYLTKGMRVIVVGRFQTDNWQDDKGNKRTDTYIKAEKQYFGEKKKNNEQGNSPNTANSRDGSDNYGSPAQDEFYDPFQR